MRSLFLTLIISFFTINENSGQSIGQYEDGFYIVAGNPYTRVPGKLKTRDNNILLVKTSEGNKLQFFPEQIISFRAGNRKFIVVERFKINEENAPRGFAEIIDSGQVLLMRYNYTTDKSYITDKPVIASTKFPSGNPPKPYYLIRKANSYGPPTALVDDWFYGSRKVFNRTLAPFVPPQRPDLIKLVTENIVSPQNIEAFIHALNTGQPFK